jgi:hypothetical protein
MLKHGNGWQMNFKNADYRLDGEENSGGAPQHH